MEKDKDLDNIFKGGLENPDGHPAYREDDWDAMEAMLDKGKKRPGIIYWLPVLSGVAALLLVFFGLWFFRPDVIHHQKPQQTAANDQKAKHDSQYQLQKNPGKSGGSIQRQVVGKQDTTSPANFANNATNTNYRSKNKPTLTTSADGVRRDTTGYNQIAKNRQTSSNLVAFSQSAVIAPVTLSDKSISPVNVLPQPNYGASSVNRIKVKTSAAYRPQYALSVLASSDLNGVNSLQQSKVGTNVGLLFSAGVFKKFTISTGATYSAKPYMTDFAEYHTDYQFQTNPVSVQANCRMLDIPLNIDYQLYHKRRNKFSIGTGVSSYLMLHENYDFNYGSATTTGPAYYNVPHPDKYFFSILNLQATYERQINSKVGISMQPYMKLPLSNVGASQVRLQTTGVAVGLTWNLNSLTKP